MKKALIITILGLSLGLMAQNNISTKRIGDIRYRSTLEEVEKKLGKKLKLTAEDPYNNNAIFYTTVKHYNSEIKLRFYKSEEGLLELIELATQSPNIKTLSGISIGDSLEQLLAVYSKYDFYLNTDYENKNIRYFSLIDCDKDINCTVLSFTLINNRITEIKIETYYDDAC